MADSSKKMQIVFASAECAPFVKTGGLGDVAGSLPAALVRAGAEVIVMVPKYATIKDEYKAQMEHFSDFYVSLGWRNEYCGLEKLEHDGVTYMFIDNERYFARDYPYGFFDDGERFAFFSKAITESLQHLPAGFECDILHCNDWQTALAPVFLREFYQGLPLYDRVKTVFSIHNVAFQGQFSDTVMEDILGVAHIPAAASQLRCDASINYMLGALHYADAITTVSPTYAGEIQTPEFGEGLDGVLRERSYALQGILNGIDVAGFDPATDKRIAANYTIDDRSGKAVCKAKLQEELGLEVRDDRPLMVMVTRLTRQKGMDLVMYALDRILSGGVQVAVLGTGDRDYEDGLRYFQDKYPGTMAARIEFDPALSQRMYAAADMFLMPSKFEPCGLSQIIAMRYGTLPIVRETGGLKDTVIPYNEFTGEGTGFSFSNFNGDEMGDAVFRAARLFWDNRDAWNQLVTQAMSQDFSWTRSADKYLDLYFFMHPEIERPAGVEAAAEKAEAEPEVVAEAEPVVEAPAAAEEPKTEEKPVEAKSEVKVEAAPEAEAKPAAKPTAKKTTTRKTTAKKATTTMAAATKTDAAKTTTAKATTTRKRTTAAAKKAAEAEIAPEVKAETATAEAKPVAKAPAKSAAKKTAASKTATTKKATATKSTTTKAATTKAAAKTTAKAAAKSVVKVEEAPSEPKAKAAVEAKPAAKTTTRKRATTTAKKTTAKAAAPKAEAKAEDKPAVKAEPAPKAAEVKTAPKATAKTKPAKETPVSPAVPAEEKAPTKKTSVRKATATRKRH